MTNKAEPMKILVVDNTREASCFGSKNIVNWVLKTAPEGSEVLVRRGPDQDLMNAKLNPDAMVVSGSITSCLDNQEPWIKPHDDFLNQHLKKGTPILGICYGHQALARCLFGMNQKSIQLRQAKDAELGWAKITRTDLQTESELFKGLPNVFTTFESHYEEVYELPPGTRALATTDRCKIQAFEVTGKAVFGIQFHPEYSVEEAEESLQEKTKKGIRKDWILNIGQGPKVYDEQVGKIIFGNFIRIAQQHRK